MSIGVPDEGRLIGNHSTCTNVHSGGPRTFYKGKGGTLQSGFSNSLYNQIFSHERRGGHPPLDPPMRHLLTSLFKCIR